MSSPKQLARMGIFYLEEAVLDVLFQTRETSPEDPFVRAVDISRKMGVHNRWNDQGWLMATLLAKLEEDGRVEQKAKHGPWKLTDAEYQKRC